MVCGGIYELGGQYFETKIENHHHHRRRERETHRAEKEVLIDRQHSHNPPH